MNDKIIDVAEQLYRAGQNNVDRADRFIKALRDYGERVQDTGVKESYEEEDYPDEAYDTEQNEKLGG